MVLGSSSGPSGLHSLRGVAGETSISMCSSSSSPGRKLPFCSGRSSLGLMLLLLLVSGCRLVLRWLVVAGCRLVLWWLVVGEERKLSHEGRVLGP